MVQKYEEFLNQLDTTKASDMRKFETYVLSLMEHQLKAEKKLLIKYAEEEFSNGSENAVFFRFDGLAPEGIDGIKAPAIIDFKARVSRGVLHLIDQVPILKAKYGALLLVLGMELKQKDQEYLEEIRQQIPDELDFKLVVWDFKRIRAESKKQLDYANRVAENINKEMVKTTIQVAEAKNWREQQQIYLTSINQSYQKDDLVFFLGAGVSKDAGLPTWQELIRKLNVTFIEKNIKSKLDEEKQEELVQLLAKFHADSPLISASYLKKALDEDFVKEIKKALYANLNGDPVDSPLLDAIAKSARPVRGRIGIESIITYNFDDLLEQHLDKKNVEHKSIYREGEFALHTKLPIYHVHGFMPCDYKKYSDLDQSLLVLSEDGYHALQSDSYSWSNLVQLKALRDNTVVLIGMSGIDPNLRRLFNIFAKRCDKCKHFIVLHRQLTSNPTSLPDHELEEFSNLHHAIQEAVFKEMGLNVIWYEDHKEVQGLVEEMTKE